MTLPDGGRFIWKGFYTGPGVLDREELARIARLLLGLDLDEVPRAAARELTPYVSAGAEVPSVVLHSATPVLKFFEADLADARSGRPPDDVATYVETRAVALARPGDLVIGRTRPWRDAAELARVEAIAIPGIDYYYLSHAILKLLAETLGSAPPVARLIRTFRDRPRTLVRLYSLDRETQILLMYLRRRAGIDVLYTDANSPEVGDYWNTKAPLHPTVEDAVGLDPDGLKPYELLAAEAALAPLWRRLGAPFPALPGYTIAGGGGRDAVSERFLTAARLLAERYGLRHGCLKPSQGGAGARIIVGIPLDDAAELGQLSEVAAGAGETYVLEAQVDYERPPVGEGVLRLAPSGHVRHGHLASGLMLQFMSGTSWKGNVDVDEHTCESLGLAVAGYREIRNAVGALRAAFEAHGYGLVTAGIDFAVGRIGGVFGDRVLITVQDPNLSSHGAEHLRLFLDEMRASGGPPHGATRVICPAPEMSLRALRALDVVTEPGRKFKTLSSVPGRWGMIAVAAETPVAAVEQVLACERQLVRGGHLAPA